MTDFSADKLRALDEKARQGIALAAREIRDHLFENRASILAMAEREKRMREALEPFAKLAGPINGEAGRPTYLEAIGGPNGTDELLLSTLVGDGTRFEILDAADFRAARRALGEEKA